MENTESGPTVDRLLDSVYLKSGAGLRWPQNSANLTASHIQGTQGSFHLSQVKRLKFIFEQISILMQLI